MTEPINLAQLRARAERWREDGVTAAATDLLALIDVAEAARAFLDGPTRIENHPDAWQDLQALYDALARFDFT